MKKGILIGLIIIGLYACSPVYLPNHINTPLLTRQGELNANLNVGISGFNPQISYAITDQLSVMANGSFVSFQNDGNTYPYRLIDLALGYNKPIWNNGIFETYTGFSNGQSYGTFFYDQSPDNDAVDYKANIQRLFLQPAFGFRSQVFDMVLANRLILHKVRANGQYFYDGFTEPVLNMKLGYKAVKLTGQFGLSIPLSTNVSYSWVPYIFYIGLQVKLFKDYKK
ncbi:MAG: hypothetical protein GVY19_10070 [Bacteroidetes bacterium]|jgi:hypothetical protein|nr:hypothetical protein [Bacteroidota bacterium]